MKNFTRILAISLVLVLLSAVTVAQDDLIDNDLATGIEIQAEIQELVDNPDAFVGEVVTIEGDVGQLVNVRAFTLLEDAVLGVDGVLVVNNSGEVFDLTVTNESRFLVTGIVHDPIANVYGDDVLDYDREYYNDYFDDFQVTDENLALYDTALEDYRDWTVIEITNPGNIVPAVTLQDLAAGAEPYDDGRVYAVEGYVNDVINDNLFLIGEGAEIANARVMVFSTASTDNNANLGVLELGDTQRVRVYGTISGVADADFVTDFDTWNETYGYGLDYDAVYNDDDFAGYDIDQWEAMFANLIVPLPDDE